MPDSRRGLYLIAYDIADPVRLGRIHRLMKKRGLPVQYSVFTVSMRRRQLLGLLESVGSLMDRREDDLRCYRLAERGEVRTLGRQYFPNDVMLFSGGVNLLPS